MIKKIITILITFVFVTSCKKFVDIPLPLDQVQSETVFKNELTAKAAVVGLYAQMQSLTFGITNGGLTLYPGLSAGELQNTAASTDLDPFYNNSIPATNSTGLNSRLYTAAYKYIYHANSIMEKLETSSLPPATKTPLIAEVKLIRSLLFHYMVNLFGDIPLVTTTDYYTNAVMPRTAKQDVYVQIIKDAEEAYNQLPLAYSSATRARANKTTAAALLARYYLYTGNWVKAEAKATEVISSGLYTLQTNLNNTFLNTSPETIWQLPKDAANTTEGQNFIPSSATVRPTYVLTNNLVTSFESNDARKINWTKQNTVSSQPYYYPNKYKTRLTTPITEAYIIIRLAEIYLIRAEAETKQNKLTEAIADINTIRTRAGLPATTASTQPQLLLAIEQERKVELFAEWGHRWFDLKRTGRIDEVIAALKPAWLPTAALYPIPQNELLRNAFLTQNPGY